MRLIKNKYVYRYKCMLYIHLCYTTECNANMVKMKVHQVQIVAAVAKTSFILRLEAIFNVNISM